MSLPIDHGLGHIHGVPDRRGTPRPDLDRGDPTDVHLHIYVLSDGTTVNVLIHIHRRAPQAVRWLGPEDLTAVEDPDWWPEGGWRRPDRPEVEEDADHE